MRRAPKSAGISLVGLMLFALLFGCVVTTTQQDATVAKRPSRPAVTPANSPPSRAIFAAQLSDARKRVGLSRKEAGARTGISTSALRAFERARAVPSAGALKKLSAAYRLSLDAWSRLEIARYQIGRR